MGSKNICSIICCKKYSLLVNIQSLPILTFSFMLLRLRVSFLININETFSSMGPTNNPMRFESIGPQSFLLHNSHSYAHFTTRYAHLTGRTIP